MLNSPLNANKIAHRGAGQAAPENTLAAFRKGAELGFCAFECDVKVSADGIPFLLHDETLERTTSGCGAVVDKSWHELSLLDAGSWHSSFYAGEPIPSLFSVAQFIQFNDFFVNIEIKPCPGEEERTGEIVAHYAEKLWRNHTNLPLLSSFQEPSLMAAKRVAPELPRALLLNDMKDNWLSIALDLECSAVVLNHKILTIEIANEIHRHQMAAWVYTVNDAMTARQCRQAGADRLITDEWLELAT